MDSHGLNLKEPQNSSNNEKKFIFGISVLVEPTHVTSKTMTAHPVIEFCIYVAQDHEHEAKARVRPVNNGSVSVITQSTKNNLVIYRKLITIPF